jgi:tRNA (Thr-GGU) A37 N-methylase
MKLKFMDFSVHLKILYVQHPRKLRLSDSATHDTDPSITTDNTGVWMTRANYRGNSIGMANRHEN